MYLLFTPTAIPCDEPTAPMYSSCADVTACAGVKTVGTTVVYDAMDGYCFLSSGTTSPASQVTDITCEQATDKCDHYWTSPPQSVGMWGVGKCE